MQAVLADLSAARFSRACRGLLGATEVRFVVTGSSAALLFFGMQLLAARLGLTAFAGTLAAYAIAFVAAYATQRVWTFRGRHRHRDALPRYLATQVGCALLSAVLAHALTDVAHLPRPIVAAVATVVSSAASYLLSRYWAFGAHLAVPATDGAEDP